MSEVHPFAATIRLEDVILTRNELAQALDVEVAVLKLQRSGSSHYAGISVPLGNNSWSEAADTLVKLGSALAGLIATGRVKKATLDLAFGFSPECVTRSATIPSLIAGLAGRSGMDVEVSTYPVDDT